MTKKKLVFFVNTDWYFRLHWLDRAIAANNENYEVHVLCNFRDDDVRKDLESHGFVTHNSGLSEHSLNPISFIRSLIKCFLLIKKINPHLIHTITIKPAIIGGLTALMLSCPVVISFAGLGRVYNSSSILMKVIQKLSLLFYSIIVKNKKSLLLFEHAFDKEKFITLLGKFSNREKINSAVIDGAGIDVEKYPFTDEPKNKKTRVLFASRLLWSKGLGDLIEVKKRLLANNLDFELDVAGITVLQDADSIPHERIIEWEKNGLINWLGKRDDICDLIKESNVIALPTVYSEGIPRILLEASSIGRTCISYDTDGCKSLILNNTTGFLISKGDLDEFCDVLSRVIIDDELRREVSTNARRRIENIYCSKNVITKTLNVYRTILK